LAAGIVLEWLACGLLVFRRRRPIVAGTLAGLVMLAQPFFGPELNEPSAPILVIGLAIFSLGRYVPDLRGLAVIALLMAVLLGDMALTRDIGPNITDVMFAGVLTAPPYVFGRLMRLLADRNRLLADRNRLLTEHAALLVAQQESAQREAVAAERARMAREVHDVIAHSVSVMSVQAAAAEDLLRDDPQAAATALRQVQAVGRGALTETGRLLRLLRDTDDELGLAPERTVADLEPLVSHFRRGGLDVDLTLTGPIEDLPAGVGVSAYRVTREILTNALKYAADRRVTLHIARQPDRLDVSAENRVEPGGPAGTAGGSGTTGGLETTGGLGLVGMAERVAVHGGAFEYGRRGDRFMLTASLPLPGADP
jgi:signal transduction histidine kinase